MTLVVTGDPARAERGGAPPHTLVYGGDAGFAPYEFLDEHGEPRGFNVEIVREIARRAGVRIEIRLGRWSERMAALEAGRVDLLTLGYSDSRAARYGFLDQTWTLNQGVVLAGGRSRYPAGLTELGSEVVSVEIRSLMDEALSALPDGQRPVLARVDTQADAVRLLLDRRVTAVAGNTLALHVAAIRLGARDLHDVSIRTFDYRLATQKGREADFAWLGGVLDEMRRTGVIDRLVEQHLGMPAPVTSWRSYATLLTIPLVIIVVSSAGVLAWILSLRATVRARTREIEQSLAERDALAGTLRAMVERTAATGEDFLRSLTEQLGTTLGASHCFVAELDPDRPARVRTLAKWTRAGFQPNTEYDLAGTPCEHAVGRQACYFASGVRELFPADAMLQASDVDSYLGIALSDSQGGRLGLLSAMSDRPIATRGIDARTLLEILAGRAAAEIDRLRSERRRRAAEAAARDMEAQVAYAQKLESLGVLAGGIAHDFNNLLVGVLGNAGLVLADLEPDSPLRPPVEQIETAAVRAAELTDQMLAYSGRGPFTTAAVDMTGLVREMGRLLEAVLSKKARVRYDCDPDLPAVDGDAAQLRQVVMNLLTNASEALGDGDGEIHVTVSRQEVSPEALAACQVRGDTLPGPAIAIVVADTGCGMDEETSRRIFDPFFTTKFTGRGLGLAAVAGIVRGHRGAIRISSAPGRGTTFTVLLPAAAVPASAVGAATHAPSSRGAGTVLVVDDEPPVRQVSRQALERAGFTVVEAEDGEAALELFARDPDAVALVLLDLTMPRMDGGETLRRLRETRPGVRVVLTSGFKQGEATDRAAGDSSLPFIQKPYQVSALVEKVHEVLGLAAS